MHFSYTQIIYVVLIQPLNSSDFQMLIFQMQRIIFVLFSTRFIMLIKINNVLYAYEGALVTKSDKNLRWYYNYGSI